MRILFPRTLALAILAALLAGGSGAVGGGARRVAGHVPLSQIRKAHHLGRHDGAQRVALAVSLRARDPAGLNELVGALYDPNDPRYHQFLTAEEFRARFSPSDADVAAVSQYFAERGLRVRSVTGNNLLVNVEGSSAAVESAFAVELHDYSTPDGRRVFAPDGEPLVQGAAAERVQAVNGLSTFARRRPSGHKKARLDPRAASPRATIGSYMTPTKMRNAYGMTGVTQTGAGETLALFELDGYALSDITTYAAYFGLTVPTLVNTYVSDGVTTPTGAAGANTDEVVLDIELAMAMATGLTKIMVYEGPNTDTGVLNTYSRIASDNLAKQVSTSWGSPEDGNTNSFLTSENTIFQQMATQGQTIFAAAGDAGAYDDYDNRPTTLVVDDPASQPYVTSVGGTTLTADAASGAYTSETTWGSATDHTGGGGGVSVKWSQPSYQANLNTTANRGSATMRMVPDVSLDADPNTGYPIYSQGGWYAMGGTSAAAPIWAAFIAVVNQGRVANGMSRVGYFNTTLYQVARSNLGASSFHDIADNSTNLYYPAVSGYDLATGWGTLKGSGLYAALTASSLPPNPPGSLALSSSVSSITATWSASSGATSYKLYRSSTGTSGTFSALTSLAGLTYTDSTSSGTTYYYVTAVNSAGESGPSVVLSAATSGTAPGAPSGLTGTVIK